MAHKLGTASVAKQNAAFDAIFPEVHQLILDYVPPFFQSTVLEKFESPQGRAMLVKLIDDGLEAAEKVP